MIDLMHSNRSAILAATAEATGEAEGFFRLMDRAAGLRAAARWREAASACRDALGLYPYSGKAWFEMAEACRQADRHVEAEIAYRTACAYGCEPAQVVDGLGQVLRAQELDPVEHPVHPCREGVAAVQAPGRPDVELLARLAWQTDNIADRDVVQFLRHHATLDGVLAAMVADRRFARANCEWLALVEPEEFRG